MFLFALQSCQLSPGLKQKQEAAWYNTQLGLAYLNQGDREMAKRKLLLAVVQDPNSPAVNTSMAYLMEKMGNIEKADYFYRKAMQLTPGQGAQLNNYGAFLCRLARYQQAEHYFLLAVKDPQYEHTAAAYENAGLCVMAMPNYQKAKHYFEMALAEDPARIQSQHALMRLRQH